MCPFLYCIEKRVVKTRVAYCPNNSYTYGTRFTNVNRVPSNTSVRFFNIFPYTAYSFTPPKVRPAMNCRCRIKNTITDGTAAITDPAAMRFHEIDHWPRNA